MLLEHMVFGALKLHLRYATSQQRPLVVVHGKNRRGVDAMASMWARSYKRAGLPVNEEPHRADWRRYRNSAGPVRNAEMVAAGADVCLVFILDESSGTSDCWDRAKAAGIPVEVHELWSDSMPS